MGAFGNYHHNPKPVTDFTKLRTVPVIANFNTEGKIRPEYFRVVNPDQSEKTYKIDAVKVSKVNGNVISFICLFTNYGKQREVLLKFYVEESKWTVNM